MMRTNLWSLVGVMALLLGFASGVSASAQDKSWEVDVYGDEAEITYVPDGRDDIHVYDHNNHNNDRSYIEVDQPRRGYSNYGNGYYDQRNGYYDRGSSSNYGNRYSNGRYDRYDSRRSYASRQYRPTRYRVEYHNRHRGW